MTHDELREAVLRALTQVAPEADPASVDAALALQEQFDLDSMDFLQFLENLVDETGIEIPERDAGKMSTLDSCIGYLDGKQAVAQS